MRASRARASNWGDLHGPLHHILQAAFCSTGYLFKRLGLVDTMRPQQSNFEN